MAATGRRYVETGSPGYVVRPKTPLQPDGTKKPGVIREKFRSVTLAIYSNLLIPLNGITEGKGLKQRLGVDNSHEITFGLRINVSQLYGGYSP